MSRTTKGNLNLLAYPMTLDDLRANLLDLMKARKISTAHVALVISPIVNVKRNSIRVVLSQGQEHSLPIYAATVQYLLGGTVEQVPYQRRYRITEGIIEVSVLKKRVQRAIQVLYGPIGPVKFARKFGVSLLENTYTEASIRCALSTTAKCRNVNTLKFLYAKLLGELPVDIPRRKPLYKIIYDGQ